MKKLILMTALLATSAFASNTGHVHFQADSTWVNPVTNRTLCFEDGEFRARVSSCIETRMMRGGEECVRWGKKWITQPANSTRLVCIEERGRGECAEYGRVAYTQSRQRRVTFYADRGGATRTEIITVPSCN